MKNTFDYAGKKLEIYFEQRHPRHSFQSVIDFLLEIQFPRGESCGITPEEVLKQHLGKTLTLPESAQWSKLTRFTLTEI